MTPRTNGTRRYNTIEVCLDCGASAATNAADCAHAKLARIELTPGMKRAVTQLRAARSYVRYLTERFQETVQIEQLAHADAEPISKRGRRAAVEADQVIERDDRQVSLFG